MRDIANRAHVLHNRRMQHRHLNHNTYTLAAIDDVIARGTLLDWQALRDACKTDAAMQQKIQQICAAYVNDRYAQRHAFWAMYVRHQTA